MRERGGIISLIPTDSVQHAAFRFRIFDATEQSPFNAEKMYIRPCLH